MTSSPRLRADEPATVRSAGSRTVEDALDRALVDRLAGGVAAGPGAPCATVTAPFTSAAIAEVPQSSPEDVAAAVARARDAQPAWAATPVHERAAVLWRLHDLVLRRQAQGLDLIQIEAGKARGHGFEEIADIAITAAWYARHGPRLLADVRRRGFAPAVSTATEVRHPWRVVGVISPWNYPLTLAVSDALPALLAGNTVVLKPDLKTPLTALWAADLLRAADLPDGVFQVVVGDGPVVGPALVDVVDYVCFTGSTATGRTVAQRAAARLIGCSLELGGKNGVYVAADADLDRAAEAVVRDCFTGAGQLCVAMERVVLHHDIADAFLARFLPRVEGLRMGTALDYSTDLGCLISEAQLRRVQAHVDDAVARGARVLTGGAARTDIGPLFYAPTVLDGVPADAACYAEETFGPVVAIHRVRSDDQAVALINDTDYGLNASVWSRDKRRARTIARAIRTGTVTINEAYAASWGAIASPMGGRGQSGLGRRHGAQGLLRFTEPQTIAQQRVGFGMLYTRGGRFVAGAITGTLRAARRLRVPWP